LQYSKGYMKILVCPDGDLFKMTWHFHCSRDIPNKVNYVGRAILSATKHILASQE
jgi:hypothetical protein